MKEVIIGFTVYYGLAYLYLIIWSIRIRKEYKLTELEKTGEGIIYAITCFIGMFVIYIVKPIDIKNRILP